MDFQPHLYPSQPTTFVGRQREVAEIIELLEHDNCQLLTLVGPGGIGKTRLATEVADRIANSRPAPAADAFFSGGVYLVSLQPVSDADNLIPAIAGAIGFEFYAARNHQQQLINHIGDEQLLLVLDNLEHLLKAREQISDLLSSAARLKILVTSREPLNLRQEWLFQVEGLPFPSSDTESLEEYDAIRLFVERGRRIRRDFSLDDNRTCVVRICQLVGGMPLAIELAAPWLRALSCDDIVLEIQRSLDILETEVHGVPDRHRSVRAIFDYSWQLLDEQEKELLMKLSVFDGGFLREAAEQIAGASLQSLTSLIDKSLLSFLSDGRYLMHDLLRRYSAEILAASSDLETIIRNRHCEYFTAFMDRPFQDYYGYASKEKLTEIDSDIDNVQTAWNWAVEHHHFHEMSNCIDGLYHYSFLRSRHNGIERALHEGLTALRAAEPSKERDSALGLVLSYQSSVDLWMGRLPAAKERADEGMTILEPLGVGPELATAAVSRAWVSRYDKGRDPEEAKALMLKAAALLEETGQYELQVFMLAILGGLHFDIGQFSESESWYQKCLILSRRIDDPRGTMSALSSLGNLSLTLGEYDKAGQHLQESLVIADLLQNRSAMISARARLGKVAFAGGEYETAERLFRDCHAAAEEWGKPYERGSSLLNLASVLTIRKEYESAKGLCQQSTPYSESSPFLMAEQLRTLGRIAFELGDYEESLRNHLESQRISKESGYRSLNAQNENALGRIAMAQGLGTKAKAHLETALKEAISIGAPPTVLEIIMGIAELLAYESQWEQATESARLVLDHPASQAEIKERAKQLLKQQKPGAVNLVSESGDSRRALAALHSAATGLLLKLSTAGDTAQSQPLLDPLSERELELLRLVAQGKSNREIALELTLALGTVKSHLHNIFQKLDVNSRTQAIIRANELGLL